MWWPRRGPDKHGRRTEWAVQGIRCENRPGAAAHGWGLEEQTLRSSLDFIWIASGPFKQIACKDLAWMYVPFKKLSRAWSRAREEDETQVRRLCWEGFCRPGSQSWVWEEGETDTHSRHRIESSCFWISLGSSR